MMKDARVLIAEDEALIAEELRDRLQHLGLDVLGVAASGEDAIAQARKSKPDLLLMDIRLKGAVDGIEAVTQLRRELDLSVIYLTAHSDDATIERAKRTEPLGYLIKPFGEKALLVTIELALHKHRAERRLRESEQRYATTLRSIGDAVIATDPEGRITFMNPVAEALTRWNHSEASGLPIDRIFRLVHAKTRQAVENPALQALRERCVVALADSSLLIARDGSEIPIDDTAAPILADHDCVSGAVLVFRDITSRLQAVEALRKTEEELRQAERVEAIGRLAGGIAHDINNRMTVVIGCCEVLLDELPPGSPHIQLAKDIKDAGDRAAWLVRQLLAFGRRQLLRPSVVSLNDVVAGMKQMIRRSIGNDVAVALRLGSDIGQIRIDPRQIEQVILNLAMNARDAMPMGGTLTIETCSKVLEANMPGTPGAQPGRYTLLTVTDTGIGMDVATKAHIFEPFFTTKPIGEGTGLGLATVYGIVKQSSGSIYVSSEPGQGTAFEIYFPEVEAPAGGSHPAPRDRRCANSIHPQAIPRARPDARRPPGARCHGSVKRGRLRARDVDDNTLRCYSGVSQGTRSYSAIRPGRRCHQPCVASRPAL